MRFGWPGMLVSWTGLNAEGCTLDNLTKRAFKQAAGRPLPRPAPQQQSIAAACAPAPIHRRCHAGYTLPCDLGTAPVGRTTALVGRWLAH